VLLIVHILEHDVEQKVRLRFCSGFSSGFCSGLGLYGAVWSCVVLASGKKSINVVETRRKGAIHKPSLAKIPLLQ
jgi:hypothetical protein